VGVGAASSGVSSRVRGSGCAYDAVLSTIAALEIRAPAESGRSPGSFAMPRATTASSPAGSSGFRSLGFGGA
jgi:hypothetical protein